MYALDTNILIYAHNVDPPRHVAAKQFLEVELNRRDASGNWTVCIPAQAFLEFINTITWSRLESPLAINEASDIVRDYIDSGVPVINAKPSQMQTVLELLRLVTRR